MFRQTAPNFLPTAEWLRYNVQSDHSVADFSVLDELEDCRQPDGTLQLKMVWPQHVAVAADHPSGAHTGGGAHNTQEWKQVTNPALPVDGPQAGIEGYEPITVNFDSRNWAGLEYNGNQCLMDGKI